jgi:hypothetical protein
MYRVKWLHVSLVFLLALGLALPAMAYEPQLNNSEVPGSVIVFPKYIDGTTKTGEPKSQFEISVGCPVRSPGGVCLFEEGYRVKLKAHWVCPADQTFEHKYICHETDFDLFTTVYGTISFNPANVGAPSGFPTTPLAPTAGGVQRVPAPPCERGYLIVWVVDKNDRPINFNALIGDAVIYDVNGSASAYNGIPIQAVGASTIPSAPILGAETKLPLTGAAGQYARLSNGIQSSVRFEAGLREGTAVTTDLTLLTLDVFSNRSNNPVFVDLNFYNANEFLVSTFTEFICWQQIYLTDVNGATDYINRNLTAASMGTQKGLVVSGTAIKLPFVEIEHDESVYPTLLGIVTTSVWPRVGHPYAYSYLMYHNNVYVPTFFVQTLGSVFVP